MAKKAFLKKCCKCETELPINNFLQIDDICFPDGYTPICLDCLEKEIKENESGFEQVDRICQWLGIPFIPDKWLETMSAFEDHPFEIYFKMYKENQFEYVDWKECYLHYKELESIGALEENIFQMSQGELNRLRQKWGQEYTDAEELKYLEKLYQGILNTYSIFGENQFDQVRKLCKISLIIEQKIRAGEDFDKYLKSYNDLCKTIGLESKNIKDATDFSSVGELFAYLEKSDWMNEYYNGENMDLVDKTMKDIQLWCRNLYVNESSIPEEVQNRIEALKIANEMEEEMNAIQDDGLDDFELDSSEEFDPEAGVI